MNQINKDEEKYLMMAIQSVLFRKRKELFSNDSKSTSELLSSEMAKEILASARNFKHITESIN